MTEPTLTPAQAVLLCDAFELDSMMAIPEERELIQEHNPELWAAYKTLFDLASWGRGE